MVKTGVKEMPCKWLCKHFWSKTSAAAARLQSRVITCSSRREKRFMLTQGYPQQSKYHFAFDDAFVRLYCAQNVTSDGPSFFQVVSAQQQLPGNKYTTF